MEIKGKVIAILPKKGGVSARTGNSWATQDFVIEVPGQYPKRCCLTIFGEDRINHFNVQGGEELLVNFDIDAREYNGRWFNEIRAYNVVRVNQQQDAQAPTSAPAPAPAAAPQQPDMFANQPAAPSNQPVPFPTAAPNNNDDLPFN